ncbi:D-glycero-alpha-D-manno-heptose 7-phosphate kinase (EC 2.7.1.168) [Azospirillum largimobile]
MIISRTPFRISFFGGGTDYPAWYTNHGGRVISTTIDKYCYITCRNLPPFFDIRHRVVWSHIEGVHSIHEILHPAVREGLKFLGFTDNGGVEIHHQGDLPARTGMGSSSSFAVGLILALKALRGESIDRCELARMAIALEQERLGDTVGSQDQIAAAYGGLNTIDFATDGSFSITPLAIQPSVRSGLERSLMLFYTGLCRSASKVAADVVANIPDRTLELHRMRALVDEAEQCLIQGDTDGFGALMDATWHLKRRLSPLVSNSTIDRIYDRAKSAGAVGGKLLGAGTSGFMLFHVPPDRQDDVCGELRELLHVPFRLEDTGATLLTGLPREEFPPSGMPELASLTV